MARMSQVIAERAPIRLTDFCRSFTLKNRAAVKALVRSWAERGIVRLTGKGTKANPVFIERA
jgi:hypothetical protein